jgi:hypothetical protein
MKIKWEKQNKKGKEKEKTKKDKQKRKKGNEKNEKKKTTRALLLSRPSSASRKLCTRASTRNGRVGRQIGITLPCRQCTLGGE